MKSLRVLVLCSLFLFAADTAIAADRYVRAGATGANNGTDWNNAHTNLPASLVRGDTYYIADGNYGSYTFDDANSGTALTTIRKATVSSHGTDTGWNDTYGDGQAIFSGMTFNSGYYTIDGVTGGGPGSWEDGFGIRVDGEVAAQQFVDNNSDHITLRHMDISTGDTGPSDNRGLTLYGMDYFILEYSYVHDIGCDLISMNVMNNFTIQYSKLARNHQAEPGCHGDLIEYQIGDASNFVIRYNFFEDIVGSYAFGSHGPTITGYEIYGNIFNWTSEPFFGNHLVGCLSGGGTLNNMKFYSNTLNGDLTGSNVGFGTLRGTGNEARNNIYRQSPGSGFSFSFGNTTHSANTFYNGSGEAEQNLSGNPFVSVPTNFALSAASAAGTTLSPPYDTDLTGTTRGQGGTWDRGALEFESTSTNRPSAPVNLRVN